MLYTLIKNTNVKHLKEAMKLMFWMCLSKTYLSHYSPRFKQFLPIPKDSVIEEQICCFQYKNLSLGYKMLSLLHCQV